MDNAWVQAQNDKEKKVFEKEKQRIKKAITDFGEFSPDIERELLRSIDSLQFGDEKLYFKLGNMEIDLRYGYRNTNLEDFDAYTKWFKEQLSFSRIRACCADYNRYLDSEQMEFDGDIIITDPCYIIRAEHHGTKPLTDDDWAACDYGSNMEALGIKKYMTRDTLYGDWSCTTYDMDSEEEIGEFCADAGLVSVFDLAEVLSYNPDFDYHTERKWTTTLIKDFKGTVQFVVVHSEGIYEDDTEWHSKGDKWEDFSVEVIGHGVSKTTGEPINFIGKQTGF